MVFGDTALQHPDVETVQRDVVTVVRVDFSHLFDQRYYQPHDQHLAQRYDRHHEQGHNQGMSHLIVLRRQVAEAWHLG